MNELRESAETFIADALNDYQGGIAFDDLSKLNDKEKKKLASELMDSDEFTDGLTSAIEEYLADYFDTFGDDYGINQ